MAITYAIAGGADATKFNIDGTTGKLTFKAAPDFENPGDANKDNVYEVTVKATDAGGAATTQNVKVTVTDVSENAPPQITSAAAVTVKENTTAVLTVTATDPDDGGGPPPPSGDWPDASNTGVPAGTTLTAYSGPATISANNTIVDSKTITKMITVSASGVTFRKCKFTVNDAWCIQGDAAGPMTVEDCELSGSDQCILAKGTLQRLNIHNVRIGITLKDGQSTIRDCYIHNLTSGISAPHFDAIFIGGGQRDCLIEHCSLETPAAGGTSNVFIATQWQGANIVNTTVNNCKLLGAPSYSMYNTQDERATITGTKWTNNQVQRGAYGYWTYTGSTPVRTGNTDAFSGANIDNS